jgi:hypothetical protein
MRLRRFYVIARALARSNLLAILRLLRRDTLRSLLATTYGSYKINRPSRVRRAIWFDLDCLSTSRASPNDTGIVIIIIVIGEVEVVVIEHCGAIIAQSFLFKRVNRGVGIAQKCR